MRDGHLSICGALTWDGRHSRHAVFRCDEAAEHEQTAHALCSLGGDADLAVVQP